MGDGSTILDLILFFVGFYVLIKGADWLVEGSASVAKKFKISDLVIGLTVVSFGTSAPELLVSLTASLTGSSAVAIGNVFGSNIANVFLILGATALFSQLKVQKSTVISEIPFTLTATLLVGFLANVAWEPKLGLVGKSNPMISQWDGIIILAFFILFMLYIFNLSKEKPDEIEEIETRPLKNAVLYIIAGIVGLFLGGKWVVDGAVTIASLAGLSESLIGLTIIAFGTSLPELVTSIAAARKGNADIAVGNVIGSNIFNLLWILGISASITALPFDIASNFDIMVMILASALIILSVSVGKKLTLQKWNGMIFIMLYAAYIVISVMRDKNPNIFG
jgi:cation:H+ antiporter